MTQKIYIKVGEDKKTFPIGRRGENNAREVVFDITYFKETFGNGTASLLFARPNEEVAYPVTVVQTENTVNWIITSTETAISGEGKAELSWTQNGVVVKSVVWVTIIEKDIGSSTITPPDTVESWAERLEDVEDQLAGLDPDALNMEVQRATGVEGQLSNLTTTTKTSLVAAINELNGGKVSKTGDTMTGSLSIKDSVLDSTITHTSNYWGTTKQFNIVDKNGIDIGHIRPFCTSYDYQGIYLEAQRTINGSSVVNYLRLAIDGSGNKSVILDPAVWRDAIGAVSKSGDTMTDNLTISSGSPKIIVKNTDMDTKASTISSTSSEYATIAFYDKNNLYSGYVESGQTTNGDVYLNMYARRRNTNDTGNVNNGLSLGVEQDGTKTVSLDQTAWQSALGLTTIVYNSGWKTLTLSSAFQPYGSTPVQYRRIGNIVEIEGIIQPKAEITSGGSATIGTLPAGYRPSLTQFQICQGSTKNSWLLEINSEGTVSFQRYGAGGSYVTASTNAWLPFSAVFVTVNALP